MEKCGDYTIQKTVAWSEKATFYSGAGSEHSVGPNLVVRCSRSTSISHLQDCHRTASEQQNAIQSGCRRLAPVLDFGISEAGRAYRVTLNYEASVAECIRTGNTVDSDYLRGIVSGTLRSLIELQEKCRRAHGNLTPGNVLIDHNGEVVLTDLAPRACDVSHADDLRALGTVIYQLVRRSLTVGFLTPPIEHSSDWETALGDSADGWREYTNLLLGAKKQDGGKALQKALRDLKSLDSLAAEAPAPPPIVSQDSTSPITAIPHTTSRPKRRSKKVPIALAVIAIGGITGAIVWKNAQPKPVPQDELKVKATVDIAAITALIPPNQGSSLDEDSIYILDALRRQQTLLELQKPFRGWPTTTRLKKIANDWNMPPRNWTKLAAMLATKTDIADSEVELSEVEKKERVEAALRDIEPTGKLLSTANQLDKVWGRISPLCERINGIDIVGVPDFKEWAVFEIGISKNVDEAVTRAAAAEKNLGEFASFAQENKTRILASAFEKSSKTIGNFQNLPTASTWPSSWRAALETSLRPTKQIQDQWTDSFAQIERKIAVRPKNEQPGFSNSLAALRAKAEVVLDANKDALSDEIKALQDKIRNPLEDLDKAFRVLVAEFRSNVEKSATTLESQTHLTNFNGAVARLVKSPELASSAPELLRHYGIDLRTFFDPFNTAVKSPDKPIYNFTKPGWTVVAGSETQTSSSFVFASPRGGSGAVTFHILAGQPVAMAAVETPLRLARLSGAALGTPGIGPLGFRDSRAQIYDRWLWPDAEAWQKEVASRSLGNPNDILARNVDPDACPITWVSPATAKGIAAALGARLPTSDEWGIAYKDFQADPGKTVRLRSTAFDSAAAKIGEFANASPPVTRISLESGACSFPIGKDYNGPVDDQKLLWLDNVGKGTGKFIHLIGNAAEWVIDRQTGGDFIIGGSCLTPNSKRITAPALGAGAYSDVTFRLVVPITPGSGNAGLEALKVEAIKQSDLISKKEPIKF